MKRLRTTLREHRHFVIVVTLLTLLMTFPTIYYIFQPEVFWHPAGESNDVYLKFWDVWHGGRFFSGQTDSFLYTDKLFYPDGVSLLFHSFSIPHIVLANVLRLFMPIWTAISAGYLLLIFTAAISAYIYLLWLFADKWIALFGAVVFGLSPNVLVHRQHPEIGFVAPVPLILFCFHRGIQERRTTLIIAAGIMTGLTTLASMYMFVIVTFMLACFICAFARSRWREQGFWFNVLLLCLTIFASSIWRVYPMVSDLEAASAAVNWYGGRDAGRDVTSYLANYEHPLLKRIFGAIFQTSAESAVPKEMYLGYLPLILISVGLGTKVTRRKMLPWVFVGAVFLVLMLGSTLAVNGNTWPDIRLPKYYLDQILPVVFRSFAETEHFMAGALLPLSVLSCFGLLAVQARFAKAAKPGFILALVAMVAFEYYSPVEPSRVFPVGDGTVSAERLAFLDWLELEDEGDIRLINVPMGVKNARYYNFYQVFSGYPQVEGALGRTPDSAYDYIRANHLLNSWRLERPVACEMPGRDVYLANLNKLEADGFSHVIFHRDFRNASAVAESFRNVLPSYENEFVSIYRLADLRRSCPEELSLRHQFADAYAGALTNNPHLAERYGPVVILAPTIRAADHFMRYLRHFAPIERAVVTAASDDGININVQTSESPDFDETAALEAQPALWLINDKKQFHAEQTKAYRAWLLERHKRCARAYEDEDRAVDVYLRLDIPCSAMDESSQIEVLFDDGLRLHHAYLAGDAGALHFYVAWTTELTNSYGFSLQFFDEDGNKALQHDNVIHHQLLEIYKIDASALPGGDYAVQLIVYDFETQVSLGGAYANTGERFERELNLTTISL